ncbi:MAG TPA: hypothetical protein VMY35_01755 [Phycisphaerae bacterium]|nr:hypothetical protein [Phycisphaerae bacterium]
MALGDGRIHATKSVVHGETTIASATNWAINRDVVSSVDPGPAGSPGDADEITTQKVILVTIFAMDEDELVALLDATAANLVLGYYGEAGAAKTKTVKNVKFTKPPSPVAPAKDSGIPAGAFAITGRAQWGAADTWALMVVTG